MLLKRRWKTVVGLTLATALGLVSAWRWAQHEAARRVTERLAALTAADVDVDRVQLGLFRVEARGIRLLEPGDKPRPWMTIARMRLRMPFWQAIGEAPVADHMLVYEPTITLRLDRNGRLRNRLSAAGRFRPPSDSIDVRGMRVEVMQPGREPLIATGINLQVRNAGRQLRIDGGIADLLGSKWSLQAAVDANTLNTRVVAASDQFRIDNTTFRRRPFVPQIDLKGAQIEGVTPVSLQVSYDRRRPLAYQIVLEPRACRVDVPALGVQLDELRGKLTLSNGQLTASNLACDLLGGRITGSGNLDLRQVPFQGEWKMSVNRLSIARLPAAWPVPPEVSGLLAAEAGFQFTATDKLLTLHGGGKGTIGEANVWGLPTSPIGATVDLQRLSYEFATASTAASGSLRLDLQMDQLAVRDVLPRLKSQQSWPVRIDGQARVKAELDVPLETAAQTATYRGSADISFAEFAINDTRLSDVRVKAAYAHGKADLESFSARLPDGGSVSGNARVDVQGGGEVRGQLAAAGIPLASLAEWLPISLVQNTTGRLSGSFDVAGSTTSWRNISGWEIDGDVHSDALNVGGQPLTDLSARMRLSNALCSVEAARATWHRTALRASATMGAEPPYSFAASFGISETSLSRPFAPAGLLAIPDGLTGLVAIRGSVRGTFAPLSWAASGTGRIVDGQFRNVSLPASDFDWNLSADQATLTAGRVPLYGGEFDFKAAVPFDANRTKTALLAVRKIDVSQALTTGDGAPLGLSGQATGRLAITGFDDIGKLRIDGMFTGLSGRWQDVVVDQLRGKLRVADGATNFGLTGEVFGGRFSFDGATAINTFGTKEQLVRGEVAVRAGDLSELPVHLSGQLQSLLEPVSGVADVEMQLVLRGPEFRPTGSGTATFRDLRWERRDLASLVATRIDVTPTAIQIRDFDATIGNGRLVGELTANVGPRTTGTLTLTATRVSAKHLLAPWPEAASNVEGTIDARVRGDLGATWSGTAQLSLPRSSVMNARLRLARLPIDWTFVPETGRGRIQFRRTGAQFAGGRLTAQATVEWGKTLDLSADARLTSLDMRALVPRRSWTSGAGSGRLSGKLQLHGRGVRSVQDLHGSFDGTLEHARALRLPVLRAINRFLSAGQFGSREFDSSEAKLRLARGVIHVDRLAISNSGVQLLIDGRATMRGRLDLNVAAHVGQLVAQPRLRPLLRSAGLIAQPAAPVALLAEANEFLSDRLIYLHIGGTARSPTTRLRPASFLQPEAVQFFLEQATGSAQ